jgi:hypothetical protein
VTGSSHLKVSNPQEYLANRVRQRLGQVGAKFAERLIEHPVEATIEFQLEVREPGRLTADIGIGVDGFWFTANGAALHLEMQDAGNDAEAWVELCDRTIEAILKHDLRIRTRRTLSGRRAGAVWVSLDEGGWNGEYVLWPGRWQEERFENWIGSRRSLQVQQSPSD